MEVRKSDEHVESFMRFRWQPSSRVGPGHSGTHILSTSGQWFHLKCLKIQNEFFSQKTSSQLYCKLNKLQFGRKSSPTTLTV